MAIVTLWGGKLVPLVVGLLLMIPTTLQLNFDHPLYNTVRRINENSDPFLGLVISSSRDEKTLLNSGHFVSNPSFPSINIAGRKYNIGTFDNVPAIYVYGGQPLAAVGVTVQILVDTFRIRGIINYGAAASVSRALNVTDVIVPRAVAYYSVWNWKKRGASTSESSLYLKFGQYNVPKAGENYLGSVEYKSVQFYTPNGYNETFTIYVYPEWVRLASQIKVEDVNVLQRGGVGSSDIYLLNEQYARVIGDAFICQASEACTEPPSGDFGFKAVDTESAAVVLTAYANEVPHIVFRGASNRPGVPKDDKLSDQTAKNVLKVVAEFIKIINAPTLSYASAY